MMKKYCKCLIRPALLLNFILFLTGCGDEPAPQPPPPAKTAPAPSPAPRSSGRLQIIGGGNVTDQLSGLDSGTAEPGSADAPVVQPDTTGQPDTVHRVTEAEAQSRSLIRQPKKTSWQVRTATPSESLAGKLTAAGRQDGTRLIWTPQVVSGSLALIRIPAVGISPDSSLVVFLETTGSPEGPFGSRLILVSAYDWSVINVLEIPNRYLSKFVFLPGTTKIAALCLEQEQCKQDQGFVCIDLQTGQEERFQQVDPGIGDSTFLADMNQNLIVSHPTRPELIVLPLANSERRVVKVSAPGVVTALSPDGREIAVIAPAHAGKIEIFRTADWLPSATVSLQETTRVAKLFFLRGSKAFLLCGDPAFSAKSLLVRNGQTVEIEGFASGLAVVADGGKKIYHLDGTNNNISEIDAANGMTQRVILTNRAEPRFSKPGPGPGRVQHFFHVPSCNGLTMLDNHGNFFMIPAQRSADHKGKYDERAIIFQCNR